MTVSPIMVGVAGLALMVAGGGTRRVDGRRWTATRTDTPERGGGLAGASARDRRGLLAGRAAATALGLSVGLLVGGAAGAAAGLGAGILVSRALRRLEPAADRRRRIQRAAELPLVLDLLGVCLEAGMPLVLALETVGEALPEPFGRDLAIVAGMQRLGSAPAAAWAGLRADPDLAPVVRAVERSAESGSRLAGAFQRLATERRSALSAQGESRARRAGVLAMAPLGLCFLPAFMSLGIVPIVLSLSREVLP